MGFMACMGSGVRPGFLNDFVKLAFFKDFAKIAFIKLKIPRAARLVSVRFRPPASGISPHTVSKKPIHVKGGMGVFLIFAAIYRKNFG
jgi:hypothetical protein